MIYSVVLFYGDVNYGRERFSKFVLMMNKYSVFLLLMRIMMIIKSFALLLLVMVMIRKSVVLLLIMMMMMIMIMMMMMMMVTKCCPSFSVSNKVSNWLEGKSETQSGLALGSTLNIKSELSLGLAQT